MPHTAYSTLRDIAERWELTELTRQLNTLSEHIPLSIGFMGEFSTGKSTLISELVGIDNMIPAEIRPTTMSAPFVIVDDSITEIQYFREGEDEELVEVDLKTFQELTTENTGSRPIAMVPEKQVGIGSFRLVDTPGLSSFTEKERLTTFLELATMDAVILCSNMTTGNISAAALDFITSDEFAHLRDRTIFAFTHADQLSPSDREEVLDVSIEQLSSILGTPKRELRKRVVATSAGPKVRRERNIEDLKAAIRTAFDLRRNLLQESRKNILAADEIPFAIHLLQKRKEILASQTSSADKELDALQGDQRVLDEQERAIRDQLDTAKRKVRARINNTLMDYAPRLASSRAGTDADETFREMSEALLQVNQSLAAELNAELEIPAASFGPLSNYIKRSHQFTDASTMIATAAITAAIFPLKGVANIGEAAAGGAAKRASQTAAVKSLTKTTVAAPAPSKLGKALSVVGTIFESINPINPIGELLRQQFVSGSIESQISNIAETVSSNIIEQYQAMFQREQVLPLRAKFEDLRNAIEQAQKDRQRSRKDQNETLNALHRDLDALLTF